MEQNGAFPIQTNDPICIYFEDERYLFEDDGSRKSRDIITDAADMGTAAFFNDAKDWVKEGKLRQQAERNAPQGTNEKLRMLYHERENGNYPATTTEGKFEGKTQVAR